jgi:hypothetical protein
LLMFYSSRRTHFQLDLLRPHAPAQHSRILWKLFIYRSVVGSWLRPQ